MFHTDQDEPNDFGLESLFHIDQEELELDGSYHLDWLFQINDNYYDEEDIDPEGVADIIKKKKVNILYSLFKQDPVSPLGRTPKRKLSPQEENVVKMKRLTLDSGMSPILKQPGTSKARTSAKTPAGRGRRAMKSQDQGRLRQALLPQFWKSEDNKPQE